MRAEFNLDLVGHDISNMHQRMEGQLELAEDIMAEEGMLQGDEKEPIDMPLKTLMRSNKLIENALILQTHGGGEYKLEPVDIGGLLGAARLRCVLQFRSMMWLSITPRSTTITQMPIRC